MNEISFRGKRKDNGKWVYGAYFELHHNDGRTHVHHFIIPDNIPISKDKPIGEIQVAVIPETSWSIYKQIRFIWRWSL